MKNLITLAFFLVSLSLFATDRVVQQGGPVGTYSSISAAVTAAVDGDKILINNKTDMLPWIENITVNKSLTFLSAVDNVQFWVEGNYTVTLAENRKVTIVGMRNTSGGILYTGAIPVNRTEINILQSDIVGNITFNSGGTKLYLGNTKAKIVEFTFGNLIGNDLRSVACYSDPVATTDVNLVIGNRIGYVYTPSVDSYSHNNNTQYLYFSNNFIHNGNSYNACSISQLKTGSTGNKIINCAFWQSYALGDPSWGGGAVALRLSFTSGTLTVENSSMGGTYGTYDRGSCGVFVTTNPELTTFTYNMFYNPYSGSATTLSSSLNNFSHTAAITHVAADGSNSNVVTVDAGNPMNSYLDLDLSRNNIGCWGGSYSMQNFFPLVNGQSSRVNYVSTPRVVNLGGTVNVTAIGIDE